MNLLFREEIKKKYNSNYRGRYGRPIIKGGCDGCKYDTICKYKEDRNNMANAIAEVIKKIGHETPVMAQVTCREYVNKYMNRKDNDMNILDFNNKEFKEAILNNIENKENLDNELLEKIIKSEVDELAERVAHSYDSEIENKNRIEYLKEYYKKHMVNIEDYKYLDIITDEIDINDKNKILVRIDNVEEQDYKGKRYSYDYLIYTDNIDVYGWENLFVKRSNVDEDFIEIEIDDHKCELLDYYMFKN